MSKIPIGTSRNLLYNNGILSNIYKNIFAHTRGFILFGLVSLFFLSNFSQAAVVTDLEKIEETKYGPEYFYAIQGEVYGQAAPGVEAVYINGKKIPVEPDLTFRTGVSLKKGEKYLTIETRYRGLRFIKKYLVVRHPAVKKPFKIEIPRQEFQKIIATKKAPPPKRVVKKVSARPRIPPDFTAEEFKNKRAIRALSDAIDADDYGIPLTAPPDSVKRLNQLLRTPNFYDLWVKKHKGIKLTDEIQELIKTTGAYRNKRFSDLTPEQQYNILLLNRLLLELTYPDLVPKLSQKAPPLSPEKEKWLGFEFVAELAPGRLLVIRSVDGKYFALIFETKTNTWIPLQEISYEEFKDLLEKGEIPPSIAL